LAVTPAVTFELDTGVGHGVFVIVKTLPQDGVLVRELFTPLIGTPFLSA
jgi:hypothetical protein